MNFFTCYPPLFAINMCHGISLFVAQPLLQPLLLTHSSLSLSIPLTNGLNSPDSKNVAHGDCRVQALFQCVTESLTQSGVMSNFERPAATAEQNSNVDLSDAARRGEGSPSHSRRVRWYDLTPDERSDAASQVHAVVSAQIGALAHSMAEFGCATGQACAFVRRLSIRHQLPLGQRSMLLRHLLRAKGVEGGGQWGGDGSDEGEGIAREVGVAVEAVS